MKHISIALFVCLLLASQISCKKEDLNPPEGSVNPPEDSTNITLLAEGGRSPAWSPNGKKIAYIYEESLYLMNSDGSDKRELENDLYEYPPIWSPSGDNMLYLGHSDLAGWDLFRIDANGENKTSLCGTTTKPHHASWSPDGQKIAFTTYHATLSVMNADGTNLHTVLNDVNTWQTPRWSPDMNKLLFTSGFDYDRDAYLINSDGSNLIRLPIDSVWESDVQFSIDGTKVFTSGNGDIYSINSDGSGITNLTDGQGQNGNFQLSPDGTKVAFTSSRDGDAALYIMASDGSGQQGLVGPVTGYNGISWSPDGKEIAFYLDKDIKGGIYSIMVPHTIQ